MLPNKIGLYVYDAWSRIQAAAEFELPEVINKKVLLVSKRSHKDTANVTHERKLFSMLWVTKGFCTMDIEI